MAMIHFNIPPIKYVKRRFFGKCPKYPKIILLG
jgi:hypothetical protein